MARAKKIRAVAMRSLADIKFLQKAAEQDARAMGGFFQGTLTSNRVRLLNQAADTLERWLDEKMLTNEKEYRLQIAEVRATALDVARLGVALRKLAGK